MTSVPNIVGPDPNLRRCYQERTGVRFTYFDKGT
jgi:hypothetical protein